jgi:uncharacterized protein YdeI (YjbR/CyaY-like superfamily)
MRADIPELTFSVRSDFRTWLKDNSETSEGVWLVFDKTKERTTLSANDALEEALCFGWIDGQMQSIDDVKYRKYFTKRRTKSIWSEKNKKTVEVLRSKGIMTDLGESAVEEAKQNGMWDANAQKATPAIEELQEEFVAKLRGLSPAYENYCSMSPSIQRTYARRYHSFKTEEARQRDFEKIVERLSNNLKPM